MTWRNGVTLRGLAVRTVFSVLHGVAAAEFKILRIKASRGLETHPRWAREFLGIRVLSPPNVMQSPLHHELLQRSALPVLWQIELFAGPAPEYYPLLLVRPPGYLW